MSVIKVKVQKDFTVLYNIVLENPNLSFKAKGLWAYCMSRPDDWQFHVSHLATVSKSGSDAVYSAIKELIAEGLVQKVQKNEKGKFGPVDYIIYPYPQLKECLPHAGFPETEKPRTENPALPNKDSIPSTEKEVIAPPAIAEAMCNFLLTKIKKQKENFTGKVTPKWIKEADKLLKTRSPDELRKVIDWVFDEPFWSGVVMSPGNLLKNLDKIEMQMLKRPDPKSSKISAFEENRKWSEILAKHYQGNEVDFSHDYIGFKHGQGNYATVGFKDNGFREQVASNFRKMGINIPEKMLSL